MGASRPEGTLVSGSAGTVNLILGLCSQRPVGCSDSDHECSYQRSYKPLAQLAYRFPDSRWMFHLGGELLEWIDRRHPELIMLLREMVKRRQMEPLGGGFYAPVLPVIPALDRVGQIEKLTTELRVRFGTRPRGVWLADCVWEPSLAHSLVGAGMEFTFLDSRQFRATGVAGGQLHRAHLTEDEGRVLSVMPIHHRLGELMESVSPEQAVASLCRAGDLEGNRVAVALDEPEDLGDLRWLERFLELVSADTRIVPTTPRAYLRRHGTDGFVYLDCGMDVRRSSSSRTDAVSGSDHGVFRRNVSRLPDCRLLYAKMVHSYLLVNQVRGDRERRRAARNDLWRGQCGHAYWSRPDGGIHTRRTRDAVYEALLQAEVQARDQTSFLPSVMRTDYDMDGHPELLYHGRQYNAYVHTAGGILFELDYLPGSVNYMNTFTRTEGTRTEGPGPDRADPYLKRGFVDHVLASAPTVADYTSGFRSAPGPVGERYVVQSVDDDRLTLLRRGVSIPATAPGVAADGPVPSTLHKSYRFRARSMEVRYDIAADRDIDAWLGVEINLAVAAGSTARAVGPRGAQRVLRQPVSFGPTTLVEIDDPGGGARLTIRTGEAQAGIYAPVHVGGEYQYCGLVIAWRLRSGAGVRWTRRASIAFSRLRAGRGS